MKKPKIFLVIDQGMIWEAYSDQPVEIIIKNDDRQFIRHLEPNINPKEIDKISTLLYALEEEDIKMPGQAEEEAKHIKVRKINRISRKK